MSIVCINIRIKGELKGGILCMPMFFNSKHKFLIICLLNTKFSNNKTKEFVSFCVWEGWGGVLVWKIYCSEIVKSQL